MNAFFKILYKTKLFHLFIRRYSTRNKYCRFLFKREELISREPTIAVFENSCSFFFRQFKDILNYNQNNGACDLIQNSEIVELSARVKIRNLQYGDRQGKKIILHDILYLKNPYLSK